MALRAYFDGEIARLWLDLSVAPDPPNAMVISFSETSFLVDAHTDLQIGAQVEVVFSDSEIWRSRISWAEPGLIGCLFGKSIPISLWDSGTRVRHRSPRTDADPLLDKRKGDASLGAKLRRLRTQRGLRQDAIASALGVSTATVSYWESERTVPSEARLSEVAYVLGVPVEELTIMLKQVRAPEEDDTVEELRARLGAKLGVPASYIRILVELGSANAGGASAIGPILGREKS